jgi:hypothetical protein
VTGSPRRVVVLLGGQTVLLGLAMAVLVVSATSVFLTEFGAALLPYVYMVVAVAGVVLSTLMARAGRVWSLARLGTTVVGAYAVLVTVAWLVLELADAPWVTFLLVVLFSLSIPTGFVVIGSQAVRLLDVRQMKAHFPRVAAGFSIGFAIGGVAAAALVEPLGGPESLLVVEVAVAVGLLALVAFTASQYPEHLRTSPAPSASRRHATPSLRSLARNRLVVLVLGYQMLSSTAGQLLDYTVWQGAAERFPDPDDLARFLGLFGAVINVVSITFVFLVAGWLLSRFGLRLGLALNPAAVLLLLLLTAATGAALGPAALIFFVLVCVQQVVDIACTDGTTRGSLGATYQALPPGERLAAQTRVEGAGVPLALGLAGIILVVVDLLDLGIVAVVVIALALTVVWLVLAVLAYREYGVNLRRSLARRAWDPVALRVDDEASRAALRDMLESRELTDLAVALDVLADSTDPSLTQHVRHLLDDPDPARQIVAIQSAGRAGVRALTADLLAVAADRSRPAAVRAVAARVSGHLGADPDVLALMLADDDRDVRYGAAAGLLDAPGIVGRQAHSVLNEPLVKPSGETPSVLAVLTAAPHPTMVRPLVGLARRDLPLAGLADALAAHASGASSEPMMEAARQALSSTGTDWCRAASRVVRALGETGPAGARRLLLDHLDHHDRDVADAVLQALSIAASATGTDDPALTTALATEYERVGRLVAARATGSEGAPLRRALDDELDRSRERVVLLLGIQHEPAAIRQAARALASSNSRPLALETLEVTMGRHEARRVVALLDPLTSEDDRRQWLAAGMAETDWVQDMLDDPDRRWLDPWLQACAFDEMARLDPVAARDRAGLLMASTNPVLAETARSILARSVPPLDGTALNGRALL